MRQTSAEPFCGSNNSRNSLSCVCLSFCLSLFAFFICAAASGLESVKSNDCIAEALSVYPIFSIFSSRHFTKRDTFKRFQMSSTSMTIFPKCSLTQQQQTISSLSLSFSLSPSLSASSLDAVCLIQPRCLVLLALFFLCQANLL